MTTVAQARSTDTGSARFAREERPWARAALWLLMLAPFFYATYGVANWLASVRQDVPAVVFPWERFIPFLAWTIVPYWSINLLYGLSLFVCSSRRELSAHGRRLLTAQVVAVFCFVAFPLRFSFERPEADGFPGLLFAALSSFDRPFNQAPSLHIALLVILWALYAKHVGARWRWLLHLWFALIGVSVLTTYQHHFLDVPTGAALGLLCLWLWPEHGGSPLASVSLVSDSRRRMLGARYLTGAGVLAAIAAWAGGLALWLFWPALSLSLVAAAYLGLGAAAFQKAPDGRMSMAALLLLAPYLAGAWLNSRAWTWIDPAPVLIADGVWLSRFRDAAVARRFATVIDCTAELPRLFAHADWRTVPLLDLVDPTTEERIAACAAIADAQGKGDILICCALGFGRSAALAGAWLVESKRSIDIGDAFSRLRQARPGIVAPAALPEPAAAR